jgi:hypothetical protein
MRRLDQSGLTVSELLIAIVVSSILMITITGFSLRYWSNASVLQSNENTLVSRLNTGDFLRSIINSANNMISQNDIADSHTLNADPANVSGNYWLPIHAIPGTTNMGASGSYTPVIYLTRPSIDNTKSIVMNGTAPYYDNLILYMNGTTKQLKARILANPNAANNSAKTTCPPSSASNACPADLIIADNVSSVGLRFFSKSGNTIDYTSLNDGNGNYNGPDFQSVEVLELTLNISKTGAVHGGATTANQTVIRVALRN